MEGSAQRSLSRIRRLLFPDAHCQIEWSREHLFLDKELRQVVRDAELGRRFVDKLARVTRIGGGEGWVYFHAEVQVSREADFAKRIFVYNYRLFERYDRPVASHAVLANDDGGWRPDQFRSSVFGCEIGIHFPVAKLTDHADRLDALLADANPFALVTAAHLLTRQTRQDPATRFQVKRRLVRLLYDRERLVTERGMQQGIVTGEGRVLRRQLARRFGPLPQDILNRIDRADSAQLETWADRVIDAASLDEIFAGD